MFHSVVHRINSFFEHIKKILLVFIVLLGVIALFNIFTQDKRIKVNRNDVYKNNVYINESLAKLKNDPSEEGKLKYKLLTTGLCNYIAYACESGDEKENYQHSLIGKISSFMAFPFSNPPASALVWIQDGLQNSGFVPDTYAYEGIGFASIKGYTKIWTLFRNLSLMLLVLFMVILGFLIMFRVKLDSQTAITIQSALPRIVITMILITFSFAIAGFMIDMMYLVSSVLMGVIFQIDVDPFVIENLAEKQSEYLSGGFWRLWPTGQGGNVIPVGYAFFFSLPNTFQVVIDTVFGVGLGWLVTQAATRWADSFIGGFKDLGIATFSIGDMPSWLGLILKLVVYGFIAQLIPGFLIGLVLFLTLLYYVFKIFFILLSAYIRITIYIIFAPIILLFNVFPGNNSFGWWIRNLIGELLTFTTVIVISLVGHAIIVMNTESQTFYLPFLYGFDSQQFGAIVAMGIVLITPNFIQMVKGWVGVGESPLQFGAGTFFEGSKVFGSGFNGLMQMNAMRAALVGSRPDRGLLHSVQRFIPGGERLVSFLSGGEAQTPESGGNTFSARS